jgi:hypothetical protein
VNEGKLQLLEFLRGLSYKGRHLLINPNRLLTLQQLQGAVLRGDRFLDEVDEEVREGRLERAGRLVVRCEVCGGSGC